MLVVATSILVALLVPLAVRRAVRSHFVDHPDTGRKDHDRAVPPVGGLVVVPVFLCAIPFLGFDPLHHWPFYLSVLLILGAGVTDDWFDLSAHFKLGLQIAAAAIMTLSGEAVLRDLGYLFGGGNALTLGPLAIPFTMVCMIFLMNAMNMIDGVDGLAGGISLVMLFWLLLAALLGHDALLAGLAIVLIGALIGFLVHNMRYPGHRRATVFLGDAGSMTLGLLVAWLAINVAESETPGLHPIGVAFIILLPIIDTFALFIARLRSGRRAFQPGQDHIHHRLMIRGAGPARVTLILVAVTFISGAFGVLGPKFGMTEGTMTFIWLALLGVYTFRLVLRARTLYVS
jgi:UDP-GlcNAc:undecaprenyl-phosphate/decaprenyl-phosphate GlcNAc-1-phosphate transferase